MVQTTVQERLSDLWYILAGGANTIGSFCIALTIVRHKALRSKPHYIIIAGLAAADCLNCSAYCYDGFYQFIGRKGHFVPKHRCLFHYQNLMFLYSETAAALMLAVVSADRLYSVARTGKYFLLDAWHAWFVLGLCYSFVAISGSVGALMSYADPSELISDICEFAETINESFFGYYHTLIHNVFAFGSIAIYFFVWLRSKRSTAVHASTEPRNVQIHLQQQARLTRSLALSSFCTLCFVCLPQVVTFVGVNISDDFEHSAFNYYIWNLYLLNPMSNIVIYWVRHKEIRMGLTAGRQMPANLNVWLANNEAAQNVNVAPFRQNLVE